MWWRLEGGLAKLRALFPEGRGLGVGGRKREMVGITVRGKRVGSRGKKKKEKESKREQKKKYKKNKSTKSRSCNRGQIFGVVLVEYKQLALQRH